MYKAASIVIPSKDKNSRLRLVLGALNRQIGNEIEVIVVFDGCRQETLYEFEKLKFPFNPIKVVSEKNVGRAAARNIGIKKALGEIIIFLDDDRIPGPLFIANHLRGHKKKRCVLLGSRSQIELTEKEIVEAYHVKNLDENLKKIISASKEDMNSPSSLLRKIFLNNCFPLKWMNFFTGNSSVSKKDLLRAGLFDEKMTVWGHEDIDIGYRLYKLGIPFCHDASIINYHLAHNQDFIKKWVKSRSNVDYMKEKYRGEFISQIGLSAIQMKTKYFELKDKLK